MKVIVTQLDMPPPVPAGVVTGIVAQPGGQTGAKPLLAKINVVNNVAPGTAVKLEVILGQQQTVFNRSGRPLPVYPTEGTQIEGFGLNVAQTVADGSSIVFTFDGIGTWLMSVTFPPTQSGGLDFSNPANSGNLPFIGA